MAEEKIDGLEGLDDFGDDFGEQLDSFMENDGDDESDSELDSFYEDLSTIDDLEGDDDSDDSADSNDDASTAESYVDEDEDEDEDDYGSDFEDEEDDHEVIEKNTKKKEKKKENKKENKKGVSVKGSPLKPVIISSLTGLLLGVITIVVLYIFALPSETPVIETVVELPPEPVPVAKIIKPESKKPEPKPKSKTKVLSFYVQAISCISHECVDESRLELKSLGYKSRVRNSTESSGIAEVISTNILGEENSAKMVIKINSNNPLAGHAFRKSVENGFRVSLGLFPDLETANRVRTYLNQAFKEQIFFKIQRTTQKILYHAVQIGGFKSRRSAEKLRDKLKNKYPNFQGAFVKTVVKR